MPQHGEADSKLDSRHPRHLSYMLMGRVAAGRRADGLAGHPGQAKSKVEAQKEMKVAITALPVGGKGVNAEDTGREFASGRPRHGKLQGGTAHHV